MKQTKEIISKTRAPVNEFNYSTTLATPEYRDIVTPNSNTLYFTSWLDLSKGPVVSNEPENKDNRYYTVQMLMCIRTHFRMFQPIYERTSRPICYYRARIWSNHSEH